MLGRQYIILVGLIMLGCNPNHWGPGPIPSTAIQGVPPGVVSPSVRSLTRDEIIQAMEICGTQLSSARKPIIAEQLIRITHQYFPFDRYSQAFMGLLCIESRFNPSAHSKAGAVGIAQLMPKYATFFSEECGLGAVTAADLEDTEVNLTLGACHFSKLLDALDWNIALALSGYNSGQDSETTKRLARLIDGHPETMGYIAKFYSFLGKLQNVQGTKPASIIGGK